MPATMPRFWLTSPVAARGVLEPPAPIVAMRLPEVCDGGECFVGVAFAGPAARRMRKATVGVVASERLLPRLERSRSHGGSLQARATPWFGTASGQQQAARTAGSRTASWHVFVTGEHLTGAGKVD
jgi:hypothetical protein